MNILPYRPPTRRHAGHLKFALLASYAILTACVSGTPIAQRIDAELSQFVGAVPGCAVGVQLGDSRPILRAAGLANLDHGIPITPDSVFEAGSVSKQFTAAAVLMLARDSRLALDDDIRRYFPELPDYGAPISVLMLLNHTSGLRDWGDVQDAADWPRGERPFTQADVLHIAASQQALNYAPGTAWSYTNTGFNLAAMLVERVSGESLADFSRREIFEPLGMTKTRWRDDYRAIVPGRAVGYARHDDEATGYRLAMPLEDAHGNGGLRTTVSDLLAWDRALASGQLGTFVTERIHEAARLADGGVVPYGAGLGIDRYAGVREIAHAGATAGYTAWLARYPDDDLRVALLCNSADINPRRAGRAIAGDLLGLEASTSALPAEVLERLQPRAGWYAAVTSAEPLELVIDGETLRAADGPPVTQTTTGAFRLGSCHLHLLDDGRISLRGSGAAVIHAPRPPLRVDDALRAALPGSYRNAENGITYDIRHRDGAFYLSVRERPGSEYRLQPAYDGAFTFGYSVLQALPSASGDIDRLRVSSARLWDLRFDRLR